MRVASILLFGLVGCGTQTYVAHCVPGAQHTCACPGGAGGAQLCGAEGTYGPCLGCAPDAGPPVDAGPPIDAPVGPCTSQHDCASDLVCGLAHVGETSPSCYPPSYAQPASGGFGTDCATTALGCSTAPSPCADGFTCDARAACDPAAVCTRECTSDVDCPPRMFCGTAMDTSRRCMMRGPCARCVIDDECGDGAVCATDAHGERFCARRCAGDADCPPPTVDPDTMRTAGAFDRCAPDLGGRGQVCMPVSGFCHGPSALAGIGEGGVCAWCRDGEPGDCATGRCVSAGSSEHLCTEDCTLTADAAGAITDTCPAGSYCVAGATPMPSEMLTGACAGDPTHVLFTCRP